jgi:hypothetical protein
MPVIYPNSLKDIRMNAVSTALGTNSVLVVGTGALTGATGVLVSFPLPTPAASSTNGVLTFAGLPITAVAANSGTAARAELRDSSGNVVVSGLAVGVSGTSGIDVTISNTSVAANQPANLVSAAITHG